MNLSNLIVKIFLFLLSTPAFTLQAQVAECTFKEPLLNVDFGTGSDFTDINIFPLPRYKFVNSTCPNDGNYSYSSNTSGCFNGDWLTFNEDHTPGDKDGKMMLVNASESGGVFLNMVVSDLKPNTTYELASWLINVCRISGGCAPLPPNIIIKLLTTSNKKVVTFQTGPLSQNAAPKWKRYSGMFTTPAGVSTLILSMEDITLGGCGNDFALDDLTIRECIKPEPISNQAEQKEVKTPAKKTDDFSRPSAQKKPDPPVRENIPLPTKQVKKEIPGTARREKHETGKEMPQIKREAMPLPIPEVIAKRSNTLVKQIKTDAGEILIELYDNGDIDGDTVTVYDNNKMVISKAGLSAKSTSFHITVDKTEPHHELVMVANNLGSIPPNTSIMVITAGSKRYEVFISSSEQQNAKVIIELE